MNIPNITVGYSTSLMACTSRRKRTYGSFNKLSVIRVEYRNTGIVNTAGEIGEKYAQTGPSKSYVKKALARGFAR